MFPEITCPSGFARALVRWLLCTMGALVPALVRNFTPDSPHIIRRAPNAYTHNSEWIRAPLYPRLPQETELELTLAPSQRGLKKKSVPEKSWPFLLHIFSPSSVVGSLRVQHDLRWSRILEFQRTRKNQIQIFLSPSPKSLPTDDVSKTMNITRWKQNQA